METLKFYCIKTRKSFKTDKYKIVNKKVRGKTRRFAVASHEGVSCWRILGSKNND